MLDVHAPHSPLHGTKEFFFHLFTITVGLLIATQIESCVEWRHMCTWRRRHAHLYAFEIQKNFDDLKAAEPRSSVLEKRGGSGFGCLGQDSGAPQRQGGTASIHICECPLESR